jgi:hypothetical protein
MTKNQIKKYYVGSQNVADGISEGMNQGNTCATLVEATNRATEKINKGDVDTVIVVKIVRVLRVNRNPITIEDLE